jgi:uncharacterized coiled-coil protein SlyX
LSDEQKDQCAWLDRAIAEHAAYYGLSVERFAAMTEKLAELQEQAELKGWDR